MTKMTKFWGRLKRDQDDSQEEPYTGDHISEMDVITLCRAIQDEFKEKDWDQAVIATQVTALIERAHGMESEIESLDINIEQLTSDNTKLLQDGDSYKIQCEEIQGKYDELHEGYKELKNKCFALAKEFNGDEKEKENEKKGRLWR